MKTLVQLCLLSTLGTACTADELVSESTAELGNAAPVLIQAGTGQILLAVTDDNFAVYQEGQSVFATKLARHAERTLVGTVPGTNVPQVLQVGKVVFLWTNPQRSLPGFGVSPLVLWTAKEGAQVISAQSAVGLVATAASSDSRQIVFTTNVTDDGASGDLVHALTRDALHPTTLLANTRLGFPNGLCRPLANFGRDRGHEVPVAVHCAGTDTTATLSKWHDGVRTDLIANMRTPLQFVLESNADASTFLVNLANNSVATVTTRGVVTVIDPAVGSPVGFIGRHDTVGYVAPGAPSELRLARPGHEPEPVSNIGAFYRGNYNRSGYSRIRPVSSDDLVLFGTSRDPVTRLSDMVLLDVRTGETTTLETDRTSTVFSEVFTSDGEYAMYFQITNPASGLGTLKAGSRSGTHSIGPADGVWDSLAASGSDISFNTNPILDGTTLQSFFQSTGDLFVADADCADSAPRAVATQANLFYLPSHDRKKLVFPSASEPDGPGLYLASARP